jgi:adenylosuccinate synthase
LQYSFPSPIFAIHSIFTPNIMVDAILGLQWGDEGKGKIVDFFAPQYDIIARFQGGPNAGHTLYVDGKKVVLHQIPSGVFHAHTENLIGNGVVLDPITLKRECATVAEFGVDVRKNLFIASRTQVILPTHRALDKASELAKGNDKIGSTLKGIGPAYMDKTGRNGLRVGDILSADFDKQYQAIRAKHQQLLDNFAFEEDISVWETDFFEALETLRSLKVVNGEYYINDQIKKGKKVLAEGAQGTMLDIDFGTFPFVTSSNTTSSGICSGLGVAPQLIRDVMGVTKAYCTRVGSGPFPTELTDETGENLRKLGNEFGATTGRPRRCGWIDLVALQFACMINGVTKVIMTKADILDHFETLEVCHAYEIDGQLVNEVPFQMTRHQINPVWKTFTGWNQETSEIKNAAALPATMKDYIAYINAFIGAPVTHVSNGPGRDQIVAL